MCFVQRETAYILSNTTRLVIIKQRPEASVSLISRVAHVSTRWRARSLTDQTSRRAASKRMSHAKRTFLPIRQWPTAAPVRSLHSRYALTRLHCLPAVYNNDDAAYRELHFAMPLTDHRLRPERERESPGRLSRPPAAATPFSVLTGYIQLPLLGLPSSTYFSILLEDTLDTRLSNVGSDSFSFYLHFVRSNLRLMSCRLIMSLKSIQTSEYRNCR